MIRAIVLDNPQTPLATAVLLQEQRKSAMPLTPAFCAEILSQSHNAGIAGRLLDLIAVHLRANPEDAPQYAETLGAIWLNTRTHAKNLAKTAAVAVAHPMPEYAELLYALGLDKDKLPPETVVLLQKAVALVPPLSELQKQDLRDNVFLQTVLLGNYADFHNDVILPSSSSPALRFKTQELLLSHNKLGYIGDELWDFCALGVFCKHKQYSLAQTIGEIKKFYEAGEEQIAAYPFTAVALLKGIYSYNNFSDERREAVSRLVGALEKSPSDTPFLDNPELCYDALVCPNAALCSGAVSRCQLQENGEAYSFNQIPARLLNVFNRDPQDIGLPVDEKGGNLALLLEAQCGRKIPGGYVAELKKRRMSLFNDGLLALALKHALPENLDELVSGSNRRLNVYQLDMPLKEALNHTSSAEGGYNLLYAFRVHTDEGQTIDDFPELALEDIATHDYFRHVAPDTAAQRIIASADANIAILNRMEKDIFPWPENMAKLLNATVNGLVDNYLQADSRGWQCSEKLLERIMEFCADGQHCYNGLDSRSIVGACLETGGDKQELLEKIVYMPKEKLKQTLAQRRAKTAAPKKGPAISESSFLSRLKSKIFSR